MLYHALFAGLGLTGLAAAAPIKPRATQSSGAQNVVYWGAAGQNSPLSDYCQSNSGIDILVMSFLNTWGASGNIPAGNFGGNCIVNSDGSFSSSCSTLASQIKTCQSAGVKVIASLGGAAGSYSLSSQSQAESIGQYLWDAYGKPGSGSAQRPFGDVAVDGWDFDIENPVGTQFYQYVVSSLRSNFAKDTSKQYYITGAPQCPNPDANVGDAIQNSQFDYLFVQFYNNNPTCSLGFVPTLSSLNYDQWVQSISSGSSSNAKIFIGAPASPLGANGAETGAIYYASPSELNTVINSVKSDSHFGGVMLWDASWSDSNVIDGCTFAQQTKSLLTTGAPCNGGPASGGSTTTSPPPASSSVVSSPPASTPTASSPPASTTVASPPASTSAASALPTPSSLTNNSASGSSASSSGSVAQWGQCGGNGYTGPTQCQSPFKCVQESQWWSSCQ